MGKSLETVIFQKKGHVALVSLNRPGSGNRINLEVARQMARIYEHIAEDDDLRVVVITGQGENFCVGAEEDSSSPGDVFSLFEMLTKLTCPVIAAINGDALSAGLELALACDLRIAAKDASFGFPEVSWGAIPQFGGTQRLPRLVGRAKAIEMLLTAEPIGAEEACRIGLVNRVVAQDKLIPLTVEIAENLSLKAPVALNYMKEAVCKGLDLAMEQGLRLEADLYFLLHTTGDRSEGIRAFREKREPHFKGK